MAIIKTRMAEAVLATARIGNGGLIPGAFLGGLLGLVSGVLLVFVFGGEPTTWAVERCSLLRS